MRTYKNRVSTTVITLAATLIVVGCSQQDSHNAGQTKAESLITSAIAVIQPTDGNNLSGTVMFTKTANGIKITVNITGLSQGKHGFHIHEFGDCSASDGTSTGGHFNPTQMVHGAPTDAQRHSGDFGNITADSNGVAMQSWIDPIITFDGPNSIIGRGVIVHAAEDDLKTQPTGAAGARVGCGVIGIDESK